MFRIRSSIFETNSSSSDYYNDYDNDDYNHNSWAHQVVHIKLKWDEYVYDEKIDEICDKILNDINEDLLLIFADYSDEYDDLEILDADFDEIRINLNCYVNISYSGSYYPATRYSPAEYPEPEVNNHDGIPSGKNADWPAKKSIIKKIMDVFKKSNIKEIIGIETIYADDIDEEEAINNLK